MVTDFLGQPIEVGDILACAVPQHHAARLTFLVVCDITPHIHGDEREDVVRVYYLKAGGKARRNITRNGAVLKLSTETIRMHLTKGYILENPRYTWPATRPSREVAQEILNIQTEVLANRSIPS